MERGMIALAAILGAMAIPGSASTAASAAQSNAAPSPSIRWGIVETKYPADDIVVAGRSVADFGAVGDSAGDATAKFQQALDAMAAAGGGTALDLHNGGPNSFTRGSFQGDESGVRLREIRDGVLLMNHCDISGKNCAVLCEGDAPCSFQTCSFQGGVEFAKGSVTALDCSFMEGKPHLAPGKSVASAAIVGNRFNGAPDILNQSASGFIQMNLAPVKFPALPEYAHLYFSERKPAKAALYLATDERFGAKKDGKSDDTAAIQNKRRP